MMQLSPKALKDWNQVQTREEMINWHKMYTPWLNHSLIDSLDKLYTGQIQEEQKKRYQVLEEIKTKDISTLKDPRAEKIKGKLQKKQRKQVQLTSNPYQTKKHTSSPEKKEEMTISDDKNEFEQISDRIKNFLLEHNTREFNELYMKAI